MQYRALAAVSYKGTRIERGDIIETDDKVWAENQGKIVEPILTEEKETEEVENIELSSLSKQELVDKASEEGLEPKGTKADLLERLELYYQSK